VKAELYPIPDVPQGRLAILPRPRAGDWLADEVAAWHAAGIEIVVSLLEDEEIAELDLADEEACCSTAGLRFQRFPIPDRGTPESRESFTALVTLLVAELRQGRSIGVHCRMGVGRSGTLAACLLIALGLPVNAAWTLVERGRGLPVPDAPEQRTWVERWAGHVARSESSR
jgi:protein-tyrosine phosphatase